MPMSEIDPNELVHHSVANKFATITLDRPEKLNAFTATNWSSP
jgi:enoyl-CoA hydratase/carnithine racemase